MRPDDGASGQSGGCAEDVVSEPISPGVIDMLTSAVKYENSEAFARSLDEKDELASIRRSLSKERRSHASNIATAPLTLRSGCGTTSTQADTSASE